MYIDTDGFVLRQVKTTDGRRMIQLFTRKYGKISAGTSINERGKNKSALALRPFTYGRYDLFKSRSSYNINSAEVKSSFFDIGSDVEKFMLASYILEYTGALLPEEEPNESIFELMTEFFSMLASRKSHMETLASAYQLQALKYSGLAPRLDSCVCCGKKLIRPAEGGKGKVAFSTEEGGIVCRSCLEENRVPKELIIAIDFDIVDILKYLLTSPLKNFEKIGLSDEKQAVVKKIIDLYSGYHMEIEKFRTKDLI